MQPIGERDTQTISALPRHHPGGARGVRQYVREHGLREFRDICLVSPAELEEIRRIWVVDKHEIRIYFQGSSKVSLACPMQAALWTKPAPFRPMPSRSSRSCDP